MELENKLNKLEKFLSLKHFARDVLYLEIAIVLASIIAAFLFLFIVSHALTTQDPTQTVQQAGETSNFVFWVLFLAMQVSIVLIYKNAKANAMRTKQEIMLMFSDRGDEEE